MVKMAESAFVLKRELFADRCGGFRIERSVRLASYLSQFKSTLNAVFTSVTFVVALYVLSKSSASILVLKRCIASCGDC